MRAERGYVLLMVLIVILIVTSLSALAIRQSLNDTRLAFATGKVNALFVAADAPFAMLGQPATQKTILADDGILSKLITHHQQKYSTQHFITQDQTDQNAAPEHAKQSIGFMCFEMAAGLANFHPSKLSLDTPSLRCLDGQVKLWWLLSATPDADDLSYAPSGVSLADIADLGVDESVSYRVTLYSLAESGANESCAIHPLQVKSCLEEAGISHQMLVQEYDYGY